MVIGETSLGGDNIVVGRAVREGGMRGGVLKVTASSFSS
jgi:hypothetical protein